MHIPQKVSPILLLVLGFATVVPHLAHAQTGWHMDAKGQAGPMAQVGLPSVDGKRRAAIVVFEYARRCDPLFSIVEMSGSQLGRPLSQGVLSGSKIGIVLNGKFHTWHAAKTTYSNGYEAGFGVTNDVFALLTGQVGSLTFVSPEGELLPLPTLGLQQSLQGALDVCAKRFK